METLGLLQTALDEVRRGALAEARDTLRLAWVVAGGDGGRPASIADLVDRIERAAPSVSLELRTIIGSRSGSRA